MSRPKVRVGVLADAQPVIEALQRLSHDIGSVRCRSLYADQPEALAQIPPELHELRWLCVALADVRDIAEFGERLRAELMLLPPDEYAVAMKLTEIAVPMLLPLDAVLLVFPNIPALGDDDDD